MIAVAISVIRVGEITQGNKILIRASVGGFLLSFFFFNFVFTEKMRKK